MTIPFCADGSVTIAYQPPDSETWIEPISKLVRQFSHTLASRYQQDLQISMVGATLLKAVSAQSSQQWTQTQLAQDLCISESTVCTMIERFRKDGLVKRRRMEIDRRKTWLELTAAGTEKVAQIQAIDSQVSDTIAQRVPRESATACQSAITKMTDVLALMDITAGETRRAA